jgi:hypothetical protein
MALGILPETPWQHAAPNPGFFAPGFCQLALTLLSPMDDAATPEVGLGAAIGLTLRYVGWLDPTFNPIDAPRQTDKRCTWLANRLQSRRKVPHVMCGAQAILR